MFGAFPFAVQYFAQAIGVGSATTEVSGPVVVPISARSTIIMTRGNNAARIQSNITIVRSDKSIA